MNLPFSKKPNPNSLSEHEQFFALQISPGVVKSAIWAVYNDKPQVLSVGTAAHWDSQNLDTLITGADQTVSDTITRLDPTGKLQPQKVIFGLLPDWVSQDKIIPDRLALIKALSQKLDLKPVGFVVSDMAMIKHIHTLEGVPPTVILLGFWPTILEMTVVRLGKNEGTFLVTRSDNPVEDVIEGLQHYAHLDMLPSRMLLYDSGVDLEDIRQLLLSHPWQAPQKRLPFLHFPKIESLASDFSIRSIALSGGSEVAHALGLIPEAQTQDLGFTEHPPEAPSEPIEAEEVYIPLPPSKAPSPRSWPKASLIIGIAVALITLVISLSAAFWYLPKARVVITINPQNLNHDFQLTADTKTTTVDPDKLIIPAIILESNLTDEKSLPTTGSKTIGEKATGTVTIFSAVPARKFAAGTTLTSPSGLKFVLTESFDVATGSAVSVATKSGKATATQVGADYNIGKDTQFKVNNFDNTILAKNDSDFSGGSSQKVKAVTKDDLASLKTSLTTDLKTKARDALLKKVDTDHSIIDQSLTIDTQSETFDHKQDDQADNLKLNLSVKARGLEISKADMAQVIATQIQPLTPPGFELAKNPTQTFTVKKADKNSATFQVSLSGNLLPKIDETTVTSTIAGKSFETARDYIAKIQGVSQVEFFLSPVLPKFLASLPHISKNIKLEIQSKP